MRILALLFLLPALAFAEDIVVDPMSATTNWALTGQRVCYTLGKSKLEAAKEPVRPGTEASLKLTYDLDQRGWVGIQWRGEAILGRVQALSFWAFGDGSKHHLAVRLEDSNHRTFEVRLGPIDWQGWRRIEVPMDETKWVAIRRYAEEPLPVRWPIALSEIRITKRSAEPLLSSVAFSELRAVSDVKPVDRVGIAVGAGAPANVFYPPDPVVLRAVFTNPAKTPLGGRVETIVTDWLGHEQRFDGGALTLSPEGKAEHELRLPITALGSYQAWVRFTVGDAYREGARQFAVSRKMTGPLSQDPSSPFGMGLYLPRFQKDEDLRQAISLAGEAGVKWTRDGLSVASLEPEPGRWAWEGPKWIPGHEGGAIEFSAGRGFAAPDSPTLDRSCKSGEVTFSLWIKFQKFDYSDRWRVLFSKGDGPHRQYYLYLTVPTRQLAVSFGDGANSFTDISCPKSDWKTGQWYHLVIAHRRADRSVRWWVDGTPAGEGQARFANTLFANDVPLQIGRSLDFALDDFAIYDRVLPPTGLKTAQPVAQWKFDEGQGLRAADASGNGNDAQMKPLRSDSIFEQSAAAGVSTYVILSGVPKWMASKPTEGIDRPWTVMPQLDKWSQSVGAIVSRYKERGIHVWEIWNEPNGRAFWSPEPNPAEYYQVLAASYGAIKKADPQATVLGISLAGPHGAAWRPPWEFVEEVLKLGGCKAMDAISIHPYRQPRSPEESDYIGDIKAISDMTAKYGRRLPIWITEVGWPNDTGGVSVAWATKMLPRAYLLALTVGVKQIAWYDYHDDGQDPSYLEHNCGILLYDLTPKPGYFAFRTMATELAGMSFEREVSAGPGATMLVFGASEKRTAVAWSHRNETLLAMKVGKMGEVTSLDLMGNEAKLPIRDGALLLALTEAPVFLRNMPDNVQAVRPITCEPAVLKLARGESGELRVTICNPFDKALALSTSGRSTTMAPNAQTTVTLPIPAAEAERWSSPVWRSADGAIAWQTPARVVALAGQREPVFQRPEEAREPVEVPDTSGLNATDEVTIACEIRSEGPTGTWQAPVTKWDGEQARNYGIYLGREKGELCFSATYEKNMGQRFNDMSSGFSLFDGKWHRVAVTYSEYDAEICFYVDGALVKRQSFDGGDLKPNSAPIRIASGFINPDDKTKTPHGAVRDVRIWNRALSAEEIEQLK